MAEARPPGPAPTITTEGVWVMSVGLALLNSEANLDKSARVHYLYRYE